MPKIQIFKKTLGSFEIGIWNLFGIWDLKFEIYGNINCFHSTVWIMVFGVTPMLTKFSHRLAFRASIPDQYSGCRL